MATTDGTLINQQLTEIQANCTTANNEKEKIIAVMTEYGSTEVSAGSSISEIAPALTTLLTSLQKGENTTTITFVINPTGGENEGYVPEDATVLAAALEGAYIEVEEIDTANVWRISIDSLGPNTAINFDNTFTKGATRIRSKIVCGASGEAIKGRSQVSVIVNRQAVTINLYTYLSDEQTLEIGRFFPDDSGNRDTFPIVATTANGVRTELFGRYIGGDWVNETGYYNSIPEFDPTTGEIASWALGPEGRHDIFQQFPYVGAKRRTFQVKDAAGKTIDMEMAGFDKEYIYGVKSERRTMTFVTVADDGTETSVTRTGTILWIARPTMDGYHIPSTAYIKKWTVSEETGERVLEMTLADGIYYGAHKSNTWTATVTDSTTGETTTRTALNTGTLGSTSTALSVLDIANAAAVLNRCTMTDDRDALNPIALDIDATGRRWASGNWDTYSYFLLLFLVAFGIDAQASITGVTSSSVARTQAGETDPIIAAGYMTGVWGNAADYAPFVFLGIENFGYGSEGEGLPDISWFSGRDSDDEDLMTQCYFQPDRAAYYPMVTDRATLTGEHGYYLAATRTNANTITFLTGESEIDALRDIHLPTATDANWINAKGCDNTEIYRSGAATGNWVLSSAVISRIRLYGTGLGVVSVGWVGNYGPGYSHADNFGGRVTLLL